MPPFSTYQKHTKSEYMSSHTHYEGYATYIILHCKAVSEDTSKVAYTQRP